MFVSVGSTTRPSSMMKMSSSDRWSSASQSMTSELSSASTPPVGLGVGEAEAVAVAVA